MTARFSMQAFRGALRRRRQRESAAPEAPVAPAPPVASAPVVDIAPNDPLIAYFSSAGGAVEIDRLELDSPALAALRAAGVTLVVPLVSQGELIGLLNLGPRLSEQDYSADDRRLLDNLAAQAAPAVRVAQLVQQQEEEAREHERIEQELRIAQLIQQQFLPKDLPDLPGWHVAAHYQPAREVGGDFYDVIELPDGRVGVVVGDVTDKGIPAALVMASTRSFLRAEAPRLLSPSAVLQRVNELLCPSIPDQMFVTCLFAVLDPASGRLRFANAGHNLPYVRSGDGVRELRATGMPLGLLPGMTYDETDTTLAPGETMLLYSDGIIEGHNAEGEMFGFPRLAATMLGDTSRQTLIDQLLTAFSQFSGVGDEQEDDITLLSMHRSPAGRLAQTFVPLTQPEQNEPMERQEREEPAEQPASNGAGVALADFAVASEPGNEIIAMERVVDAVAPLELEPPVIERLRTAVSEATMNAIEHGNGNNPDRPVRVRVLDRGVELAAQIIDLGGDSSIPETDAPNIELKLAGLQTPRGWGLFLIEHMVDEVRHSSDGNTHTVELVIYLKGRVDADARV